MTLLMSLLEASGLWYPSADRSKTVIEMPACINSNAVKEPNAPAAPTTIYLSTAAMTCLSQMVCQQRLSLPYQSRHLFCSSLAPIYHRVTSESSVEEKLKLGFITETTSYLGKRDSQSKKGKRGQFQFDAFLSQIPMFGFCKNKKATYFSFRLVACFDDDGPLGDKKDGLWWFPTRCSY